MKQDVVIHKDSPSVHFFSGLIAFIVYLIMIAILIGGFKFYKEQVRYGENEEVFAQIVPAESIELEEVIDSKQVDIQAKLEEQAQNEQTNTENMQETSNEQTLAEEQTTESTESKEETAQMQPPQTQTTQDVEPPKEVNLADAFSSVSSELPQNRKTKEEAIKQTKQLEEQRQKALETAQKLQKARAEQLAQNAAALEQSTKALQEATKNLHQNVKQAIDTKISLEKPKFAGNSNDEAKYDEWFAQIEQILMREWRKSENFYQAATHAKVKIHIDEQGKLSYVYMVVQSPYGEYNRSVIAFLKKMESFPLPPPPGSGVNLAVDLTNTLRH